MAWDIFGMGHIWSRDINGTGHIWQDINGMGHIWSIWDINGQDIFGHGKILGHDWLGHVWGTFVKLDTKPIHYLAQQLSSFDIDEYLKTYKPFVYD